MNIETKLTVTDGEVKNDTTINGTALIPVSTLVKGGTGDLWLGLSSPAAFGDPNIKNPKLSALVGYSFSPSSNFTPATAVVIVPIREAGNALSQDRTKLRINLPLPRQTYLPAVGVESDGHSFSGFIAMRVDIGGRGAWGGYSIRSSIPEPQTWTLFIAGFGFVGVTMRRQSKAIARTA